MVKPQNKEAFLYNYFKGLSIFGQPLNVYYNLKAPFTYLLQVESKHIYEYK